MTCINIYNIITYNAYIYIYMFLPCIWRLNVQIFYLFTSKIGFLSLCSPDWPDTPYADQSDWELKERTFCCAFWVQE